jgi:hypothetical protein
MKRALFILVLIILASAGCGGQESSPVIHQITLETIDPQNAPEADLQEDSGLLAHQVETLSSLTQVDPYPLYVMYYAGDYQQSEVRGNSRLIPERLWRESWACTLFTSLADEDNRLYGRNFDWEYSPMLLLFTDPPDGYAAVSVVDLAYLGFPDDQITRIDELPLADRAPLLDAPWWPFDGMNDQGLAIGMAAVPSGNMPVDPQKTTIDSLEIMREILDHARNVEEAVEMFAQYNIDMEGGPDLHYLISDRAGTAALIEFYQGEMKIIWNDQPWHMATNFLCSAVGEDTGGRCWRYDKVAGRLKLLEGSLLPEEAISLLDDVSQPNTQWSVVYGISSGEVLLAAGQAYDHLYAFQLDPDGD